MRSGAIGMVIGLCAWVALTACGSDSHGSVGGETNWLRACESSDECSVGSCVCGLCSERCEQDDACPRGLRCEQEDSALHAGACGTEDEVPGLCAPECDADGECGSGRECTDGACAPVLASRVDAGMESEGGEGHASDGGSIDPPSAGPAVVPPGPRLLVDGHLDLNAECLPQLDKPIGSGASVYDIGRQGEVSEGCHKPYMLTLRVSNPLPQTVLATELHVTLMSIQEQTIIFSQTNPALPNSFRHSVTGSVPASANDVDGQGVIIAEAIPVDYAQQLGVFAGGEILIRAHLLGETAAGEPIGSNRFDYRVSLCEGCLRACQSDLDASMITIDELNTSACDDRAGADGRYCVDTDC
jgi:hypothetical protein